MSAIIQFFRTVLDGMIRFFTWFVGLPSLIVSACFGLYESIVSLFDSLTDGGTLVSDWVQSLSGYSNDIIQISSSMPDIVRVGCYSLSLDVLFTYVTSVFGLFIGLMVVVITFFCVSIPAFLVNLYAVKLSSWFFCLLFPKGYCIEGLSALANLNISTPIRTALKDGKYNPWLAS